MSQQANSINWKNFITVVSAAILVGTETVGLGIATGWALGGIFNLSPTMVYVAEAVFGSIGIYALFAFYQKAKLVEPIKN